MSKDDIMPSITIKTSLDWVAPKARIGKTGLVTDVLKEIRFLLKQSKNYKFKVSTSNYAPNEFIVVVNM